LHRKLGALLVARHIDALFAGMSGHAALVVENSHLAHIAAFIGGQQLVERLLSRLAAFQQGQAPQAKRFIGKRLRRHDAYPRLSPANGGAYRKPVTLHSHRHFARLRVAGHDAEGMRQWVGGRIDRLRYCCVNQQKQCKKG
jgi:hypothetical protein